MNPTVARDFIHRRPFVFSALVIAAITAVDVLLKPAPAAARACWPGLPGGVSARRSGPESPPAPLSAKLV